MIANVSAHRRANAFAQALDERPDPGLAAQQGTDPAETGERSRMLTLATGLGELPSPEMDPEVKVVQRAQLVAAMEAMLREGTVPEARGASPSVPGQRSRKGAHRANPLSKLKPRTRLSKRLAAGGLTVGVAAGAFGGVAAASGDALPGDSLYGLKRGMEDLQLGLAGDDARRGELLLGQASTRLSEARRLMERDRAGRLDHEQLSEVRRALSGVRFDAGEGHRLLSRAYAEDKSIGHMQALSSFTRSHREAWSALRDRLPPQLLDVSDEVTSVFAAIDDAVDPLRSLLPQSPDEKRGTPEQPRSPSGRTSGGAAEESGRGPSSPEESGKGPAEAGGGPSGSADASEPSGGSRKDKDGGLLGGGGLLDPLGNDQHGSKESPSKGSEGSSGDENGGQGAEGGGSGRGPLDRAPSVPEVTLPPLLPGILPGLGVSAEDDDS
ncbi:DUF5667 domain-containing protein [Streptomyces sp. NPDC049954]|uniref:DUF5667 domain-containing protein n=1 Tax=Streptomyces sp. NPDC049954 TaxID=3155779 RepID=UPI003423E181